jgi:hypothetical protein
VVADGFAVAGLEKIWRDGPCHESHPADFLESLAELGNASICASF